MKIGQYCQRQRCRHAELKQFRQAFASRGFVSDSWAFLLTLKNLKHLLSNTWRYRRMLVISQQGCCCIPVLILGSNNTRQRPCSSVWSDIFVRPYIFISTSRLPAPLIFTGYGSFTSMLGADV